VDGPPGIGCPVIASLTGASQVLVVTEPTVSGEHDLERVLSLTRHFQIPAAVCVNKWDINPEMTDTSAVTRAQIEQKAVVEIQAACAEDIIQIWKNLNLQEEVN